MKHVNTRRLVLALWFVGLWFIEAGTTGSGAAYAATPEAATSKLAGTDSGARFQQLDADVEQILNDVVALGADMAVLKEARELPLKNQLLVLVSIDPSVLFQLDNIQLQIDGNIVSSHQYGSGERDAFSAGGSHRLFWGNLPAGRHQLTAMLTGRAAKDPKFQREVSLDVVSGTARRVVELYIAAGKDHVLPELLVKEWE